MKFVTKYIPVPNRINEKGTNVMFLINGEWTEPCDFDSYLGPDIQAVAGGVLFLVNEESEPIELANQNLQEGLEYDRNEFEVKWVNSKGEASLTITDVNNEDEPPVLKAFVKVTKIKVPKEVGEKMRQHLKEKSEKLAKRFPPKEVMDWMRQKTEEVDKINGGTLDKSTFMLGMQAMWKPEYYPKIYKIIIPQEEPKQETLEQATKNWITKNSGIKLLLTPEFVRESFKEGAKWQAERMYSEEDMHKAYCAGSDFDMSCLKDEQYYMFKKWFEQFKKK
jgi:hypothetical protein